VPLAIGASLVIGRGAPGGARLRYAAAGMPQRGRYRHAVRELSARAAERARAHAHVGGSGADADGAGATDGRPGADADSPRGPHTNHRSEPDGSPGRQLTRGHAERGQRCL
jgi:hypothetical protein